MAYIKYKLVLFGIFIVTQYYSDIVNAQKSIKNEIKNKEITKLLKEQLFVFPNQTEVSVALINQEKSEFIGFLKNDDSLQIKKNQNAVFEIGSISKVFTSTLLSKLVVEETLSIDEPVVNLLPFKLDNPSEDQNNITVKMLANHTSGLPRIPQNLIPLLTMNQNDPYRNYDSDKLYEYLKTDFKTESKPGEQSAYSNLGAGLLGHLLTLKTNQSFETLLQENIFKPLNMNSSTTDINQIPSSSLVMGRDPEGQETSNWNFDVLAGAGAIKSNIIDLEKFVRKQMSNDAIYNLTQKETHTINKQVSMGLGWHIIAKKDQTILFHNGGTGGYTSCLVIDKKSQKAVIMLTNISAFHPKKQSIDGLCFKMLSLIK
ncbi:serine hydrolase domain-containing protein [Aquimarina sp. SS2-1]|uniref:serine hydrolase domain-containing protein n=1 Tax=Aquimarina besae TaxID=3342247 RepID=UPI00366F8D22